MHSSGYLMAGKGTKSNEIEVTKWRNLGESILASKWTWNWLEHTLVAVNFINVIVMNVL